MTLRTKQRLLQAAAIFIGIIIVGRYFTSFGTDWRYIVAYSINPINILFYFLDAVTIILVVLVFVLLAMRNIVAVQERRQWREAHTSNTDMQTKTVQYTPSTPTVSITNDLYVELLSQQSVTLELAPAQLHLAQQAGEVIVRHEDDFGQFTRLAVTSVDAEKGQIVVSGKR